MTRAEYLKARGWLFEPEGDGFDAGVQWIDYPGRGEMLALPDAIMVQLARDADRERAEWSRYFSDQANMTGTDGDRLIGPMYGTDRAAKIADCMLEEYRQRHAVEFTD